MIRTAEGALEEVGFWHEHGLCDGDHQARGVSPACLLADEVARQQRIIEALILCLGGPRQVAA